MKGPVPQDVAGVVDKDAASPKACSRVKDRIGEFTFDPVERGNQRERQRARAIVRGVEDVEGDFHVIDQDLL